MSIALRKNIIMKIHPHLANELLSIIFNNLALPDTSGNDKSLAACRLASHVLCSLATPLLFLSIYLSDFVARCNSDGIPAIERQAVELNQILANNNNIVPSVRTLTLSYSKGTLEDSKFDSIATEILHRLPHIQKFAWEASRTDDHGKVLQLQRILHQPFKNLCSLQISKYFIFTIFWNLHSPSSLPVPTWNIFVFDIFNSM